MSFQRSETIEKLATALLKAQMTLEGATKDSVNPAAREAQLVRVLFPRRGKPGRQESFRPLHVRLLNRVVCGLSDCWHFCGARNEFGYGRMTFNGRLQVAHRLSYQAFVGPIPDGLSVLHRCDNPSCINPDHLWLGTYSDNRRDCVAKGRHNEPSGERHWNWKGGVQ